MTSLSTRRGRITAATCALLATTVVAGLGQLPADATIGVPAVATPASHRTIDPAAALHTIGDPVAGLLDVDTRGTALPSLLQKRAAARIDALSLRWNAFGTPASILPASGVLARATSKDPVVAARTWLSANHTLFGITQAQVAGMQAIDQKLAGGAGDAVFFRQTFGGLLPAIGSAVTVAVGHGEIVYVSSSITKTTQQIPAFTLSPLTGWLKAAANVGIKLPVDLGSITRTVSDGWTRLDVPGLVQQQMVRPRALANADGTVRPVLEANVINVQGGTTEAYTVLVDGVTGRILHRHNAVDNFADIGTGPSTVDAPGLPDAVGPVLPRSESNAQISGSITASKCGPKHAFKITDDKTKSISVLAVMVNPADDITINLYNEKGQKVSSADLATSPEVLTYGGAIAAGTWSAEVCPFSDPDVPLLPPFNYAGTISTSDTASAGGGSDGGGGGTGGGSSNGSSTTPYNPRWSYFTANPTLDSPARTPRNGVVGCWVRAAGCTTPTGPFQNVADYTQWDVLPSTPGVSTHTTIGNNAITHEAWASPLSPGGLEQAPISATGDYTSRFTDAWNNSECNPLELIPGGNDINFAVGNLFVTHNRMHDWSYYLGFTEGNSNLQTQNGGRGGRGNDAEVGNVQAGALGGLQDGLGRDNANQIALQDGVPGITNQYLFQPVAGAFYAPCTDGDLDQGIVGHEYTHAISNRMIGGPDESITSEQGGSMGESWSDLDAGEYQFAHGYYNGGNTWGVGLYATGNKSVAIRDYSVNHNPLNYSDFGFDTPGPEVHADGEIWNGTNWEVRSALVKKYDKQFPYKNKRLQLRCAQATPVASPLAADKCPGNRRWIQMMFDSFLFQQGATSMLDARDGVLASEKLRFGNVDKQLIWDAFARRGMGVNARTKDGDDVHPTPSFQTIGGAKHNTKVTFTVKTESSIFVGDYMARARAIADNTGRTKSLKKFAMFAPGTYDMLSTSTKNGFMRFHMTVKKGTRAQTVKIATSKNYASSTNGAKIIGTTGTTESRMPDALIDSTERNGWGAVVNGNVDAVKPSISVDLSGSKPVTIRTVAVSAELRPPLDVDPDAASRFTALRRFAIEACAKSCTSPSASWKRVFTSRSDAFPAVRPRPVAPNEIMRAFRIKPTKATALRLVVLENQCTGYAGYAGQIDKDPLNVTDCKAGSDRGTIAHVAELQAFATDFPSWRSSYGIDNPERSFR